MSISDRQGETSRVADMLQRTFDAQPAGPLDPALIQLMLELSHAPDAEVPDSAVAGATPSADPGRRFLSRVFANRWPRRASHAASPPAD